MAVPTTGYDAQSVVYAITHSIVGSGNISFTLSHDFTGEQHITALEAGVFAVAESLNLSYPSGVTSITRTFSGLITEPVAYPPIP